MDTVSTTNQAVTGHQIAEGLRHLALLFEDPWVGPQLHARAWPDQAVQVALVMASPEAVEVVAGNLGVPMEVHTSITGAVHTKAERGLGAEREHGSWQVGDPTWTHPVELHLLHVTDPADVTS